MTINAPAAIMLAFYVVAAEEQGVPADRLAGTIQADILKEYIAQKEWCFPIDPAMRLLGDMIEWCSGHMPRWHPVSISGYHIREAGSTAAQELAFTLKDGLTYVEQAVERGLDVDDFAPRLSFFFNAQIDFFEEIAKYRAARRIWARELRETFGAKNPRSWLMRFHTQTAGVSLTAQQPLNNIVRTAIEALAGVLGGTQSLHTNSYDEALALPTEDAVRIALRTQQIIAHETGVTNTIDPLGGSYFVEALTDELERQAYDYFAKIDELGGMVAAVKQNYPQREIADASYRAAGRDRRRPAHRRRRQRVHASPTSARWSCIASIPRWSPSRSRSCRPCAPAATARRSRPRWPRSSRRRPTRTRTSCRACSTPPARTPPRARSSRRCRRSSAPTPRRRSSSGLPAALRASPAVRRVLTAGPRTSSQLSASASDHCGVDATTTTGAPAGRETVEAVLADPTLIRPVFQPIVDLRRSAVQGYEMLARFANDPSGTPPTLAGGRRAPRAGQRAGGHAWSRPASRAREHLPRGTYLSLNVSPGALVSSEVRAVLDARPGRPRADRHRGHRAERRRRLRRARHGARPRPRRRRRTWRSTTPAPATRACSTSCACARSTSSSIAA